MLRVGAIGRAHGSVGSGRRRCSEMVQGSMWELAGRHYHIWAWEAGFRRTDRDVVQKYPEHTKFWYPALAWFCYN